MALLAKGKPYHSHTRMKKQLRLGLLIGFLFLSITSQGKKIVDKADDGQSDDGTYGYFGIILGGILGALALLLNEKKVGALHVKDALEKDKSDGEYNGRLEISFAGIKVALAQKKDKPDKLILDGSISGKARPGRLLAIMGPSGSGKSSLLDAIAGKIKQDKKITVVGKRYINDQLLAEDSSIPAAFIAQDTNFFPYMTVKETLDFRVNLSLGHKLGNSARNDVVSSLLDLMGLVQSVDTIVGNEKVRGISGGERKRLSIACEMISSPPVIFMDEPTSGLDSYQAAQVVHFLRKLADNGKTVVTVIHQPSQEIFSMFDDLILISEGRLMYYGEIKKVKTHFGDIGYKCENEIGTAEHILNCISRTNDTPESDNRLDHLANEALKQTKKTSFGSSLEKNDKPLRFASNEKERRIVGPLRQFRLLFRRAFREERRGKAKIIIKVVQQVGLASIFGGIYKLGRNQESVMDRFGLISLVGTAVLNMGFATSVRSFPKEKAIVSSEMSIGMYRTLPYLLSKAMAEIPFLAIYTGLFSTIIYPLSGLQEGKFMNFFAITSMHAFASSSLGLLVGSMSPSSDVALALMAPTIVLSVIFDGRNISIENTPIFLRWIPKVGLIKWFFEGISINEFTGLTFDTSGNRRGAIVRTGYDALDRFGISERNLPEVFTAQGGIIAGCWILSFVGIKLNRERFEKMSLPLS